MPLDNDDYEALGAFIQQQLDQRITALIAPIQEVLTEMSEAIDVINTTTDQRLQDVQRYVIETASGAPEIITKLQAGFRELVAGLCVAEFGIDPMLEIDNDNAPLERPPVPKEL